MATLSADEFLAHWKIVPKKVVPNVPNNQQKDQQVETDCTRPSYSRPVGGRTRGTTRVSIHGSDPWAPWIRLTPMNAMNTLKTKRSRPIP